MYIRHLLTCITLLASSTSLLYAAPCYTDTTSGCSENNDTILVKTNTTISGDVCTEYTNEAKKIVTYCYPSKIEIKDTSESINKSQAVASKAQQPIPTNTPVTINNVTYNTIYSQAESVEQPIPIVENARDVYWQSYYQGYSNPSFYGYNHGYGHRPLPPPQFNNNRKQIITTRPLGKNNNNISKTPSNSNMNRPKPPMYERPHPQNYPNMRPPANNRSPVQSRPMR